MLCDINNPDRYYLANARQYTREVYVPLSITLEDLRVAYEDFRRSMKLSTADTAKEGVGADQERFLKAIDEYETAVGNLLARGADAFLTTALDENFRSFNSFLYACRAAREPVYRKNLQYSLRTGIFGFFMPRFSRRVSVEGTGSLGQNVNVDWFLGSFSYEEELLQAPLQSEEFERRLLTDVAGLKELIKEVIPSTYV